MNYHIFSYDAAFSLGDIDCVKCFQIKTQFTDYETRITANLH